MKKMFYSLAFMLIGSFAFANTESQMDLSSIKSQKFESISIENVQLNLEVLGTCYVSVGLYDEDGNKLKTIILQFDNVDSAEDCDAIGDIVQDVLNGN
jgi:hypothetical protein